ncbi:GNAT family N-acetyltransferase [Aeromonas bestiarum]|uniref:GNAT family N-acetyltransferase n=1 Tax=Aeromonas bestiarum TaxID=105751 RepID=UPI002379E0D0|nr:GNAT family N-acetyltransferase [Aeromonas bestiarum]WDL81911.1 GNAT family N-acetyltransferase [Aeromonas bestiarum]
MQTELRRLQATDGPALQRLFELAPAYQAAVSHDPLSELAGEEELFACPPDLPLSDKHLIGLWEEGELTAVVDLLHGYPDPATAYLGLLLVGEPWQGAGRGQALYLHACMMARSWGATRLRLSVIASNETALSFWLRRGFTESYRRELAGYRAEAIVLERTLEP